MSKFVDSPKPIGLTKLSGRITNYRCERGEASFVLTSSDQTTMGIIAVAAALAGMSGQAIGAAGSASSLEEEADHITFIIEGQRVEGWVWRSPFKEGDIVDVAAEWLGDHFEAYGIARPLDGIVALYPHCSRGRLAHFRNALFWYFWVGFLIPNLMFSAISLYAAGDSTIFAMPEYYMGLGGMSAFFGIMFFSLARKWLPFVRVAEKVFTGLGWRGASGVDLVKSSKLQRTDMDRPEFGTFYFRYRNV